MKSLLLLAAFTALAGCFPRMATGAGTIANALASTLTRRPWTAGLLVAALPMTIRLALLPWWPIPTPVIPDEFCYVYAADTFASARMANPAHPLWQFFEAPNLVAHPLMYSKYPPAQGLILAGGQLLLSDPWFGVWLSSGFLCAACYWLGLAMAPPKWALLMALIPAGYLALSGYWMNSYWGGNVAASAGAIVLGAFLRLRRRPEARWAVLFAVGWTVLAASRPYEGAVLFALPLAGALVLGKRRFPARVWGAGLATAALGGLLLGSYNMTLTGRPWRLPYSVYSERYMYVPPFSFMGLRAKPPVRQDVLRATMEYDESRYLKMNGQERFGWLGEQWWKILTMCLPSALLLAFGPLLIMLLRKWQMRWLAAFLTFGILGLSVETYQFAHYFAPFVPLLFLLTTLGLRLLTGGRWQRALQASLLAVAAVQCGSALVNAVRYPPEPPLSSLRPKVEEYLTDNFEEHLVFVRDITAGGFRPSWVFNRADIEKARLIWAADLGPEENAELIALYPRRRVWLLPIKSPLTLQAYDSADPLQRPVRFE